MTDVHEPEPNAGDAAVSPRRRSRWLAGGVVLVLVAIATALVWVGIDATRGSHDGMRAVKIADATAAADTARMHSVVRFGGSSAGVVGYDVTGAVDFARNRGDLMLRALTAGPSSAVDNGNSTAATAETRWIGDRYYTNTPGGGWSFVDAAKVRAAASCLAHADVSLSLGAAVESPASLLDTLREHGADLQRVGTDTLDGTEVTHWREAPRDWPVAAGCTTSAVNRVTKVKGGVDLWTDAEDRARRIELRQTQTSKRGAPTEGAGPADTWVDTIVQTTTYTTDFSDFGTAVDVQVPPAHQVTDATAGFIALMLGPGQIERASDWKQVWSGTVHGSAASIDGAPTTTGYSCYDTSALPQSGAVEITANGFPTHDGHVTTCIAPPGPSEVFGAATVFINETDGDRRLVVGAIAGHGAAQIILADGSAQPLVVDANTLIFEWSGPARVKPVKIEVGRRSCELASGDAPCIGATP